MTILRFPPYVDTRKGELPTAKRVSLWRRIWGRYGQKRDLSGERK